MLILIIKCIEVSFGSSAFDLDQTKIKGMTYVCIIKVHIELGFRYKHLKEHNSVIYISVFLQRPRWSVGLLRFILCVCVCANRVLLCIFVCARVYLLHLNTR